ncbi:MAG: helix-turn-helix transcriptional regulator [Myxococcota bacterium]
MQDPVTADAARRIRELRKRAGLSIEALAERAEMPPDTLARIERGSRSPTLRTVGRIAAGLGVEPVTIFWTEAVASVPGGQMPEHVLELVQLVAGRPPRDRARVLRVARALLAEEDDG